MDKEAARVEHLKLIQQVIERLARSSFAIKAAASTVTAAVTAGMAATGLPVIGLAGLSLLGLWIMDAFYLSRERRFRALYDQVRTSPAPAFADESYFSMMPPADNVRSVIRGGFSLTVLGLYTSLVAVIAGASVVLWRDG